MQRARRRQAQNQEAAAAITARVRTDLALFCVVSMLFGIVGYFTFLLKLQYLTQAWYYVEMLCLCTISFDGILGANWPAASLGTAPNRIHGGDADLGCKVGVGGSAYPAEQCGPDCRRSRQERLGRGPHRGEGAWEGITFDRYYRGQAHWVTVPPIDSHKVHRSDLVLEKMNQPDPMAPVLREITNTLRSRNSVWIVGDMAVVPPKQLPPPAPQTHGWQPYVNYWSAQVMVLLQDHSLQKRVLEIPLNGPVNRLENLPVVRFSGYKPDAD